MRKIKVVELNEERPLSAQIDRWESVGWHFQGFMRRAEGIWDHVQAVFEMEAGLGL